MSVFNPEALRLEFLVTVSQVPSGPEPAGLGRPYWVGLRFGILPLKVLNFPFLGPTS